MRQHFLRPLRSVDCIVKLHKVPTRSEAGKSAPMCASDYAKLSLQSICIWAFLALLALFFILCSSLSLFTCIFSTNCFSNISRFINVTCYLSARAFKSINCAPFCKQHWFSLYFLICDSDIFGLWKSAS